MYSIAEDWALHPNVLGLDLHLPGMIASSRSRGNVCRVSTVMSDIFAPVLGFSSKMVRVSSPSSFIPSMVPVATALQPIMVSRGFFDDRWLYRILPSRDSILNLPVTIVVSSWYIASGNRPRKIQEQPRRTLSCLRVNDEPPYHSAWVLSTISDSLTVKPVVIPVRLGKFSRLSKSNNLSIVQVQMYIHVTSDTLFWMRKELSQRVMWSV
jgi:hypothetical protein